jgi:limonene-1,2-epoxide hydrolase
MSQYVERLALVGVGALLGVAYSSLVLSGASEAAAEERREHALHIVLAFLEAQSARDLERMCALVTDDMQYINEPHPPERHITGRDMFREAFAQSPCIWCEEAKLELLHYACRGDTVFVQRLDRFKIDGKWLEIPICGLLRVRDGKVAYWKDYWCYGKYKAFVTANFPPGFSMLRK